MVAVVRNVLVKYFGYGLEEVINVASRVESAVKKCVVVFKYLMS